MQVLKKQGRDAVAPANTGGLSRCCYVVRRHDDGYSFAAIGRALGVSKQRVCELYHRHSWSCKRSGAAMDACVWVRPHAQ